VKAAHTDYCWWIGQLLRLTGLLEVGLVRLFNGAIVVSPVLLLVCYITASII
jgi:hypothetical protein